MEHFLAFLSKNSIFRIYLILTFFICASGSAFIYLHINNCSFGHTVINGSTAFVPLLKDAAQDYEKRCPFTNISVNPPQLPNGSLSGLAQVTSGQVNIGSSDLFAATSYNTNLEDHQIAIVIYALVINSDVAIQGNTLTLDQIRNIYSGAITNWHDVGSSENLDIVRVSRPPTSGTRATFEKYVLGGVETVSGPTSLTNDTTARVAKYVSTQKGAIGYVSLYYAKLYHLKTLSIASIPPSIDTVKNGSYPFWNIEHLYTNGPNQGLAQAFITSMYSNSAQKLAVQDEFIPITQITQTMLKRSSL